MSESEKIPAWMTFEIDTWYLWTLTGKGDEIIELEHNREARDLLTNFYKPFDISIDLGGELRQSVCAR